MVNFPSLRSTVFRLIFVPYEVPGRQNALSANFNRRPTPFDRPRNPYLEPVHSRNTLHNGPAQATASFYIAGHPKEPLPKAGALRSVQVGARALRKLAHYRKCV